MKTFKEVVSDLIKERMAKGEDLPAVFELYNEAAKVYAFQVAEDVRQRCYARAEADVDYDSPFACVEINEASILNTEIILP